MSQTETHRLGESVLQTAANELRAQAGRINSALTALEVLITYEPVRREDGSLESSRASRAEHKRLATKPAKARKAGRKTKTPPPPYKARAEEGDGRGPARRRDRHAAGRG